MIRRLGMAVLAAALGLAGMQGTPEDDRLFDQVRRRLANDPDVRGAAFEVSVKNGVVRMRGTVEKEKYRQKAERLVKKMKGVKQVINELKVAPR